MAAYVRVSTDDDDQLGSFESQKLYWDEEGNPDPYKLTFVLKVKQSGIVPNAKEHYKAIQKELKKINKVS